MYSEKLIRDMARCHGEERYAGGRIYTYIVIDDCWQVSRDANGNIIPSTLERVSFRHESTRRLRSTQRD